MQIFERLVEIIENYVEADEIKVEDNFKLDLGMSSFDIVCVMSDIEAEFGVKLTAADFINNKTVAMMAERIKAGK